MILYHYTLARYLSKVLREGLKINTGVVGLGFREDYRQLYGCQPIFLADDPKIVSSTMAPRIESYGSLLRVDCSGLECRPEHDFSKIYKHRKHWPKGPQHTFVCLTNIAAFRLTHLPG